MERSNKKLILFTILISLFLLTGCNKLRFNTFIASEEEHNDLELTMDPESTLEDEENKELSKTESTVDDSTKNVSEENVTPTQTIQPISNRELPIYSINVDSGEIEAITALIPTEEEITPELIVDKVIESMEDRSVFIGIDRISKEKNAVIVSFDKDKAPYTDFGAGYEISILNAIAQSLIDNLPDNKNIIFRVNGKEYQSGHFELGIDEVYLGEN